MKTIEITLYKFNELSSEAQQKAIQTERENMYETGDVLHFFYNSCVDQLTTLGFKNPVIEYSLSGSQGDGLSFRADDYEFLNDLVLDAFGVHHPHIAGFISNNLNLTIKGNSGRYCYAAESDVDLELGYYGNNEYPNIDKAIETVLKEVQSVYMTACKTLENQGYDEIEYQQSDTRITETILANDYDFTENGEMY